MITLERVSKSYRMKSGRLHHVLHDVTIELPWRNTAVLGRNGAGKSTLLRMISGIEEPSAGRIRRRGKVSWPIGFRGSFHRELSGLENVRFVARIFGQDTERVIDYVEDFARIGPAFREPIKTYSTGMGARLAFGLSMAVDFDVYLIDELTAVGDALFQKKCRAAFREKVSGSRLIMVSHAPATLRDYCDAGVLLNGRELVYFEKLDDAVDAYERMLEQSDKGR